MADRINSSPSMVAQRERMDGLFGGAIQRQAKPNHTGLPDNLKSGIESLSGLSMDSVRVHYNSSQPAQLNACAYAQGTDIYIAPGQEKHLPHEAWHVVQQAQGRVQPTMQMARDVAVNDDRSLEREADVMGERAMRTQLPGAITRLAPSKSKHQDAGVQRAEVAQRIRIAELAYLETRDHGNHDAIVGMLNRMRPNDLERTLEQLQGGDLEYHKPFITICKKNLNRFYDLTEIGCKIWPRNSPKGTWTMATVFIEDEVVLKTPPEYAGGHEHEDAFIPYYFQSSENQVFASATDSEVATLHHLNENLMGRYAEEMELLSHQRNLFRPGNRLHIIITGNLGPCEPCMERLESFKNHMKNAMQYAGVNFQMEVNYMTAPYQANRRDEQVWYGNLNDPQYRSPSTWEYFQQRYT